MKRNAVLFVLLSGALAVSAAGTSRTRSVLLEAESFEDRGGWSVDQQFMDQMGSPFLLAHGLGKPVADAVTTVEIKPGDYRVWVRTRDWCRPMADVGPGGFRVVVNGRDLGMFGTGGSGVWEWVPGPAVSIARSPVEVRLADTSGFDGRVDALFFGADGEQPPSDWPSRKILLGLGAPSSERFDLVVTGGGIAGLCAAITAAREGLRVALVHDRPTFGGNASSDIRVRMSGGIGQPPFPHNADVLRTIREKFMDATPRATSVAAWKSRDDAFVAWLKVEPRLVLFPATRVMFVERSADGRIGAAIGQSIFTGRETRFSAPFFVDATGDGAVAVLAGADWRTEPETQAETGETLAPDGVRKGGDYGSSLQWYSREADGARDFPSCPWALPVDRPEGALLTGETESRPNGGWNWESGFWEDNVADGEKIRDRLLRGIYGTWDYTKNKRPDRNRFARAELSWVAYVLGKRAARRVLGDYVLCEQDLTENRAHPDGVVTTDWYIDLHFPNPIAERVFGKEAFRSTAYDQSEENRPPTNRFVGGKIEIRPYAIPYRCLYSRNVANLFLSGKDISATHVAMGSHRVMNTCGAMGTVVARAAALCLERTCEPRELSTGAGLEALKDRLSLPVPGGRK